MEITVLLEKVPLNGYRARTTELSGLTAEGATREEALARIRRLIDDRLAEGQEEVVRIQVPEMPNPWQAMAGMYKDDPLFDEWQREIAEYRRERDKEPDDE